MAAAKEASGNEQPPEFLSTHPADNIRTENLIRALSPALVEFNTAREAGKRPNCQLAR
jgi:predicted Zn-dependent protease